MIDGGLGQLNAALEVCREFDFPESCVVALAKREEEIYLPGHPTPLRIPRRDAGLRLLQEIRDESHRFAVSRHRRRRRKRILHTRFDEIPGVGPKRRRLLVERFGSWSGFVAAPLIELQDVLGRALGERVSKWRSKDAEIASETRDGGTS